LEDKEYALFIRLVRLINLSLTYPLTTSTEVSKSSPFLPKSMSQGAGASGTKLSHFMKFNSLLSCIFLFSSSFSMFSQQMVAQ
jgi:hypothetical protein